MSHNVRKMESSGSNPESNEKEASQISSTAKSILEDPTDCESSGRKTRFILPSCDGSSPKVITMDEIADIVKNIQNMTLVHEIALNPDFKLKPYEPPEDSLEGRIRNLMHKAFWAILREQLNEDPPRYDHALQLLGDIKECFPQIISASNKRLLDYIEEVLDETVIRKQAEHGVLDFRAYADFMIEIMAKSCAPFRDEEVRKLRDIVDVVDMFRGILETMAVMKLDMANCLLEFARNDLMAHSVEYEKNKFKEYLEIYKHGFPATENWLKRSQIRWQKVNGTVKNPELVIFNAYMDLLDWNEENEFPEILSIDKDRIHKLSSRALRLCIGASTIAIPSSIPLFALRPDNRGRLAREVEVLLQNVVSNSDLENTIENVALHVKTMIKNRLDEEKQQQLDSVIENTLKPQIMQLARKDSPIRNLMRNRLKVFFRLVLRSQAGMPPPPPGYTDFKEELESLSAAFKRLQAYNYSVYGEYFLKVLADNEIKSDTASTDAPATTDQAKEAANLKPNEA